MPISRRDFLHLSLLGLGLNACQKILFAQTLTSFVDDVPNDASPSLYKPEVSSETPAPTSTI